MMAAEEHDDLFVRPDHPLLNHLILNQVFIHMGPTDLKSCRSVCKKWNETRCTLRVTIYGNQSSHPHKIENFVEFFNSKKGRIPFTKFKLGSFPMIADGVSGQEFLSLCGDTMTEVSFLEDDKFNVEDVSELLKSTPRLESFTIPKCLQSKSGNVVKLFPTESEKSKPKLNFLKTFCCLKENKRHHTKYCPTFLEELFMVAPYISNLKILNDFGAYEPIQYCIFMELLGVIEKLRRESFIQSLNVGKPTKEHVEFLRRMAAKPNGLKSKNLTCNWCPIQLILLFKDTLQQLNIPKVYRSCFMEFFPDMPHLVYLGLPISMSEDFNFIRAKCIRLRSLVAL